ncbi:MAG: ammonia-dependent NAD(+) synthetase [Legionella sp.]|nr:ammonia-dependent NAD(+) synthetase [Legionella sp.]
MVLHYSQLQKNIIQDLNVKPHFNAEQEINARIQFLKSQLRATELKSFILGISGGIDSSVTGRLAQLAVEQLREEHYPAHFIAVRLPYGKQHDEEDAADAIKFINPDLILSINIKPACDETLRSIKESGYEFLSEAKEDFILGNIKARQRMIVQYALANAHEGLVIGTDHAAEALMGFFTKFGDGACDLTPLTGLNKRRIRAIAAVLKAPEHLINKKPTADLENLSPLKADEDVFGVTYHHIDDFLEGKEVPEYVYENVTKAYTKTHHKRNLPKQHTE